MACFASSARGCGHAANPLISRGKRERRRPGHPDVMCVRVARYPRRRSAAIVMLPAASITAAAGSIMLSLVARHRLRGTWFAQDVRGSGGGIDQSVPRPPWMAAVITDVGAGATRSIGDVVVAGRSNGHVSRAWCRATRVFDARGPVDARGLALSRRGPRGNRRFQGRRRAPSCRRRRRNGPSERAATVRGTSAASASTLDRRPPP
jgi:hypothetical protein